MNKGHTIRIAVLALVVLIAGAEFYQYRAFYHDDAFISLRYVRNFLNGDGLAWNAGERVEGYSNFLLVILLAALGRLGIDLVLASQMVGILSLLFLDGFVLWRSWQFLRRNDDNWLWLLPVIIATTALPLVIWSIGGLETSLFAFLITVGVVWFGDGLQDPSRTLVSAGVVLGLASLCRPDGPLFVGGALIVGTGVGLIRERRFDLRLWGFLGGAAVLIIPHLFWRYSYYHSWLPNTYYVKAANLGDVIGYGWSYFKEYSLAPPFLPILLCVAAIWGALTKTFNARSVWYLIATITYAGYVVTVGGDHMPAFRLFAPLIALSAILMTEILSSRISGRISAAIVAAMLILCAGQLVFPAEKYQRAQVMDGAAFLGSQVGKYINDNWPQGSLVALNTAGSTPYVATKLRFLDMLGLNDTTIARRTNVPIRTEMQKWPGHGKGDGRYILSRRPDYIIIGPSNGDYTNDFPWFLSDYELGGSAEFARAYQPVKAIIPVTAPGYQQYTESSLGVLRFVYYERRK